MNIKTLHLRHIANASMLAMASLAASLPGTALASGSVDINVYFAQPLRSLSRVNLGTGFDYFNEYIRAIFSSDPTTLPSYTAIQNLNFGTYRFPMGTSAEWYFWNAPCRSQAAGALAGDRLLKTDEVLEMFLKKTNTASTTRAPTATGNELLWQVNTYSSIDGPNASNCTLDPKNGGVYWRNATYKDANNVEQLNNVGPNNTFTESGLYYVAASAGNLVRANRAKDPAQQITYWEIGNEDWSRLTPEQYAQIFVKVALQMKVAHITTPGAGYPLRLLAQTTDNGSWVSRFAAEVARYGALSENLVAAGGTVVKVGLRDIYGLSLHSYATGDQLPSISDRTKLSYSRNDWATDITGTLKDIKAVRNKYTLTSEWNLWVTEYSACELCASDATGGLPLETLNQALVIADKTVRMLQLGVARVVVHSLDQHPKFAIAGWDINNNGGTYDHPRMMASGIALQKLNSLLPGTMYKTYWGKSTTDFHLNYDDVPGYQMSTYYGLTSYAIANQAGTMLNVVLINRDMASPTTVRLVPNGKSFNTRKSLRTSTLSGPLTATNSSPGNSTAPLQVGFVNQAPQATGSTVTVSVPAGGLMVVSVPLN